MAVWLRIAEGHLPAGRQGCPTIPTTQVVRSFATLDTYQLVNAFFSSRQQLLIAWDRGDFMAVRAILATCPSSVLAHEFGHTLQVMAN